MGDAQALAFPIVLVGARGYSGQELARLLLKHPGVKLIGATSSDPNWKLSDAIPEWEAQGVPTLPVSQMAEAAKRLGTKLVFLATPTETSLEEAPKFLKEGISVIDLSGAFRLRPDAFQKAYGLKHTSPEYLNPPPYALVPWSETPPLKNDGAPRLLSNPGCYATSVLMALLPLLRDGLIEGDSIVIDAKSGSTGAGKKALENLLFTEVAEDILPYRVGRHQHLPEIEATCERFAGVRPSLQFTTHLLPIRRGILSSIYARLSKKAGLSEVEKSFERAYSNYPLVRAGALCDSTGKERTSLLSLRRVVGSARVHISYFVEDTPQGKRLTLFSTIDNLMKGAASQAVENLNRLLGLPPETGLLEWEGNL